MKKKYLYAIIIIAIFAIIGVSYGLHMYNKKVVVADVKPSFTIDAAALYAEFSANEAAATKKYVGNTGDNIIVEVTGTIGAISNEKGKTYILVGEEMNGVYCEMDDSQKKDVSLLKEGNPIKITGLCDGVLMDVNMKRCFLVNETEASN